jgi:hypothetical protein
MRSRSIEPRNYLGDMKETFVNTVNTNNLAQSFVKTMNYDKKPVEELPYIVGYKGFRRGVKSGNYYGKNFKETSLTATNKIANSTN